jgi:hypothetical protein
MIDPCNDESPGLPAAIAHVRQSIVAVGIRQSSIVIRH